MLTKEQSLRRNKNIISSLLLLLVPLGGFLVYKDLNKTPTFYGGGTLTNYERTLKLNKQYSINNGSIEGIPDTEYLGYFTFLKDGFNEHTISLTSEDKPKSIHKHVHFDTDTDSVTNTFTTDGIVIDTNYKTTETKNKTLGAPTPNIKQTFILRNTTDETKETNFTSTTRLNTNTVEYNGRTITIAETPTILKAEEKTASIPEFASDIGYENPETEQFENYTHTYHTPAFLTFETDEGTAVYDWRDAQHLNHTVTLYEHDNSYYLSFTVSDITIEPQSSFEIDPSYGLGDSDNFSARIDGNMRLLYPGYESAVVIGDVNGDTYSDLVVGVAGAPYGGPDGGAAFVIFGTSTFATGTLELDIASAYNIRIDGTTDNSLTDDGGIAIGDVNGDGLNDLVLGAIWADNNGSNSGSAYVLFSTLLDDVGMTTGNTMPLSDTDNYNVRYDGGAAGDYLTNDTTIKIADVNGDGDSDLILGGYGADNNGASSGSAWVMFSTLIDDVGVSTGNNRPLSTAANYNIRFDGGATNDYLTRERGILVGDVNGDSLNDLILGAYSADNNGGGSGSVWVLFSTLLDDVGTTTGNIKLLSTSTDYNIRYDGGAASDALGYGGSLTNSHAMTIGDVNGDSLGDLILGAPAADNGGGSTGSVWVLFSTLIDDVGTTTGNDRALSTTTFFSVRYDGAAASDLLADGGAIAVGDVNGDSLGDLILGASGTDNNGSGSGSAYILFSTLIDDEVGTGNIRPMSTTTNYNIRYDGAAGGDAIGSVEGHVAIGDVNGDSLGDLILGAAYADNNGNSSGSAWVILSTLIDDVGTTTANNRLLSTAGNYHIRYDGVAEYTYMLNQSHIVIGDVNGDGNDDLVLPNSEASPNGAGSGSIFALFSTLIDDEVGTGNNKALSSAASYSSRFDGVSDVDLLAGEGAIALGDVNGDGIGDLIVGSQRADYGGTNSGSVWVVFGGEKSGAVDITASTSYNIRLDAVAASDNLSANAAIEVGDINNDGKDDLVVGAMSTDFNGGQSGSVYVFLSTLLDDVGATTGNNWSLASTTSYNLRFDGPAGSYLGEGLANARFGLLALGDVNGDSAKDLAVGSYYADFNGGDSGSIWLVFSTLIDDVGETTGNIMTLTTSTSYNLRIDGGTASDRLGIDGALTIGDVNGDGSGDVIVGTDNADYNGNNSGSAYILFSTLIDDVGATTGNFNTLSTSTDFNIRIDGDTTNNAAFTSQGIMLAGDVNGDSLGDLAIGVAGADYEGAGSGSVYLLFSTLLDDYGETTGNIIFIASSTSFNVRYDGDGDYEYLARERAMVIGDVDGDSLEDLVVGAPGDWYNGRVYVMAATLIDDVGTTTGNILPLASTTSYNIRFDGDNAEFWYITNDGALYLGDVNNNGVDDILIGANEGGLVVNGYLIGVHDSLIAQYTSTTGNILALDEANNHSFSYSAPCCDYNSFTLPTLVGDVSGDGMNDLVIASEEGDGGGTDSGSVYVIYGSPPPKYRTQGTVNFTGSVQFR